MTPTAAAGEPRRTQPLWRTDLVDWSRNWLGLFVVTPPDARQLHRDYHATLNGLEAGLNAVS